MAQVTISSVIDTPVEEVWKRIGAFDAPADWLPFVVSSPIVEGTSPDTVGCVREVTQKGGGVFREVLVALSHADHFYEYTFVSSPIPVRATAPACGCGRSPTGTEPTSSGFAASRWTHNWRGARGRDS